ncbi:MAG: polysaccharide biosynthesis tyrosine autokinase [Gemmatimonadaceae bacterium]
MSEYTDETTGESAAGETDRLGALRTSVGAIRQRWWLVLGVFLFVVGFQLWRTSLQQRQYQASAVVQIEDARQPMAAERPPSYNDYRIDPMLSAQEIIKSKEIAERVADSLGLRLAIARPSKLLRGEVFGESVPVIDSALNYIEFTLSFRDDHYRLMEAGHALDSAPYGSAVSGGGVRLTVPKRPEVDDNEVVLKVEPVLRAANGVRAGLVTKGRPQTNIVEIFYTGEDPITVQKVATTVAEQFRKFRAEDYVREARARTGTISQSLVDQRARLDSAQNALKEFREQKKLSSVSTEQSALVNAIRDVERQQGDAMVERGIYMRLMGSLNPADTTIEQLRRLAGTSAIQSNAYITNLYQQWFTQTARREELITVRRRGAGNIDLKEVDSLIALTKLNMRDASQRYLAALETRIAEYGNRIETLRREMGKYPALEAQEQKLVSDMMIVQGIYTELQSEYQRARIAQSVEDVTVKIVDEATRPTAPISPNRRRVYLTAIILGTLLGVASAVAVEQLDDSVKSPDEVRDQLGVAVLGTIPGIKPGGDAATRERESTRLVTHLDPRSPVAEAYRSLRTNLAFARANHALRTMVLTSPGPADGKSTTVANLAITFAQQGQRTLLIDADLRRAVLDKLFEVPRSPGLTDVLVGETPLFDALRPTSIRGLSVLGSGPFPPNPSELLGSPAMREVLREANEHFDVVLLDSPPLLAVTDAAVLSTMVDGVILVVRMGSTARTAVRRAIGQLQAVHGRLVGSVLNDVNFRHGGYGGGYGYYYYYYYYGQDGQNGKHNGMLDRVRRLTGRRAPAQHSS